MADFRRVGHIYTIVCQGLNNHKLQINAVMIRSLEGNCPILLTIGHFESPSHFTSHVTL